MLFKNSALLISFIWIFLDSSDTWSTQQRIEVKSVLFHEIRDPQGRGDWFEMRVVLGCVPNGGEGEGFIRRVGVTANLAFNIDFGKRSGFEFYQRRVVVASIAEGEEAAIYYYLPPAIVNRDRLGDAPFSWQVALDVKGVPLSNEKGSYSKDLSDSRVAESFRERIEREAVKNEGILLPVYDTPFYYNGQRRLADSPPYVRESSLTGRTK